MPQVFPLLTPHGGRVEIVGRERREVLLGRGYRDEHTPPVPPVVRSSRVKITADVILAPWDEARTANVSTYDVPGLTVVADEDREGCWPTVRRSWLRGQQAGGTHHLILTDDLLLPEGFWEALNVCVGMFPDSPISLLSVKKGAKLAEQDGSAWCISWGCTGAANVLPVSLIGEFLEWERANIVPECPHDDVRLTAWATASAVGVLTPVPCLVEHGGFPSVIADSPLYGRRHSTAAVFVPDVRGVDWSRGAEHPAFVGISVDRPDPWMVDGRSLEDMRRTAWQSRRTS